VLRLSRYEGKRDRKSAILLQLGQFADFFQAKCDFFTEIGCLAFLRPPLGDLGATYDDHLGLIEKRMVDFLLVLIELFSLGVTAEALRAIIDSKSAILLQQCTPLHGQEKLRKNVSIRIFWYFLLDLSIIPESFRRINFLLQKIGT